VLSLVHGAFAGTDTARVWMWWIYVVTGGLVLFLVLARGLTSGIRAVRAVPHGAGTRQAAPTKHARPVREVDAAAG
jgi:cytochrome b561